jgi:hypothetical protein
VVSLKACLIVDSFSDTGIVHTQSSGTVWPNDRKLTPKETPGMGIGIPTMEGICISRFLTTERKDGGVERVSACPSPCTA